VERAKGKYSVDKAGSKNKTNTTVKKTTVHKTLQRGGDVGKKKGSYGKRGRTEKRKTSRGGVRDAIKARGRKLDGFFYQKRRRLKKGRCMISKSAAKK